MAAAYDNLDSETKELIANRRAVHFWGAGGYSDKYAGVFDEYQKIVPPVYQPIVMEHPRTGRKTLFVKRNFTMSIDGLEPEASDRLLDMLVRQADVPEYQFGCIGSRV
jgi:taurine dioxygenase